VNYSLKSFREALLIFQQLGEHVVCFQVLHSNIVEEVLGVVNYNCLEWLVLSFFLSSSTMNEEDANFTANNISKSTLK
jgi:hypothetical protein